MAGVDDSTRELVEWLHPVANLLGLPDYLVTISVLIVMGLIGRWLVQRLMHRIGNATGQTKTTWDDAIVSAAARPAEWVMWLMVAYMSLGLLESFDGLRVFLRQTADTGLTLLLGWFLHRVVVNIEAELLGSHRGVRDSDDRAAISATARLIRMALWTAVILMMLQSVGVSISGLLAFGGIGGIAIGFAARDLLANFLGGLSIYLDRPFTVGDWIRSPDREIEGTVEHIGWRMTRIRTFDQRPLYVPNAVFSNVALENPSRMRNRRIYETVGIRYADVNKMAIITTDVKAMLQAHDAIDLNRTLMVNFVTCGPSSLDFFVYTFTKTTDWATYHGIKEVVLLKILAIIEGHGAEVAFPTRTLHVEGLPEGVSDLKGVQPES